MLPALTFAPRRASARRVVAGSVGLALLVVSAVTTMLAPPSPSADEGSAGLPVTERLAPSTWAFAVPIAWLAASLPDVQIGDRVDLLAVRQADRPLALPVAADLRVMSVDERSVVFEVDELSATAIATARASGLLIVPLLRSSR